MNNFYRTILISAQMACKTYPGGISAVAHALKVNPTMLSNKLNPDVDRNVLSFNEAIQIMLLVPCEQTFSLIAFHMGKGVYDLPACESSADPLGDAINAMQSVTTSLSKIKKAQDKHSDGGAAITPTESRAIRPLVLDAIQNLGNVLSAL